METIAYATVINANRPGIWPCHERYADKQETPKANNNNRKQYNYDMEQSYIRMIFKLRYQTDV